MTVWAAVLTTDMSNSNYNALCHTQLSYIIFLHCANRTTGVHLIPMLAALRNKSHAKLYKSRSRSQLVHAVCTTSLQATLATCLSAQAAKTANTANTRLNKTFQNQNHISNLFHIIFPGSWTCAPEQRASCLTGQHSSHHANNIQTYTIHETLDLT